MPRIHVCSLQRLYGTVRETGAEQVVTLIKASTPVPTPESITPARHLKLHLSDITEAREGEILAGRGEIEQLLRFVTAWDRIKPLVIHCYAGVSRSTASSFITACALRPEISEATWAQTLREASPTATPNAHLVALADAILGREGRMIAAIAAIGRGQDCFEGIPFALNIGPRAA